MKNRFSILTSLILISLGIALVLSGLHGAGLLDRGASASSSIPVVNTAAVQPGTSAMIAGYGTDKDTYSRGDTANGYITIKNTGNTAINDITLSASVARSVPILGTLSLGAKDFKIAGLNIGPGETKKAEFSVSIPKEFSGFSTAGDYDLNGKVMMGGKQVGTFSKHIKVV